MHEKCDFHTFQRAKVRTKLLTAKYSAAQNAFFCISGLFFCSVTISYSAVVGCTVTMLSTIYFVNPRQGSEPKYSL